MRIISSFNHGEWKFDVGRMEWRIHGAKNILILSKELRVA